MKQGEKEVINYFMEMTTLWQELHLNFDNEWECSSNSACYKKKLETESSRFLLGLTTTWMMFADVFLVDDIYLPHMKSSQKCYVKSNDVK